MKSDEIAIIKSKHLISLAKYSFTVMNTVIK